MNLQKLGRAKLGEWVFGSAMAWGCIAPSAALSDLLGGQQLGCAGAKEIDCIYPMNGSACGGSGPPLSFCACFGSAPGRCTRTQNPCVAPCVVPFPYVPGLCNVNSTCTH